MQHAIYEKYLKIGIRILFNLITNTSFVNNKGNLIKI